MDNTIGIFPAIIAIIFVCLILHILYKFIIAILFDFINIWIRIKSYILKINNSFRQEFSELYHKYIFGVHNELENSKAIKYIFNKNNTIGLIINIILWIGIFKFIILFKRKSPFIEIIIAWVIVWMIIYLIQKKIYKNQIIKLFNDLKNDDSIYKHHLESKNADTIFDLIHNSEKINFKNKINLIKVYFRYKFLWSVIFIIIIWITWFIYLLFIKPNHNICSIKWNISFTEQEKIYHLPSCPSYNATVIDNSYWEKWFCTEREAKINWWRKAWDCSTNKWENEYYYDDYDSYQYDYIDRSYR